MVNLARLIEILIAALTSAIIGISQISADPPSAFGPVPQKEFRPVISQRSSVAEQSPRKRSVLGSSPSAGSITGTASYYASWCNCTAMTNQIWRGKIVRVTGPIGWADVLINDAGPVPSLHRVADLNPSTFTRVCGPLSMGLCHVTIRLTGG